MTIEYNRRFDPFKQSRTILRMEVGLVMARNKAKAKHNYMWRIQPTSTCSQCKRKMKKSTADAQITNGRENAPICVACILGIKRIPLSVIKRRAGGAKERKKFSRFIKSLKNKYN